MYRQVLPMIDDVSLDLCLGFGLGIGVCAFTGTGAGVLVTGVVVLYFSASSCIVFYRTVIQLPFDFLSCVVLSCVVLRCLV